MSPIPALPESGFLRISQIVNVPAKDDRPARIGIIPVSRAHFWAGVKSGRFPQPTRALGPNITAWAVADIRAYIASASNQPEGGAK